MNSEYQTLPSRPSYMYNVFIKFCVVGKWVTRSAVIKCSGQGQVYLRYQNRAIMHISVFPPEGVCVEGGGSGGDTRGIRLPTNPNPQELDEHLNPGVVWNF